MMAYAVTKIHRIKMLQSHNKQYGGKGVDLLTCDLNGPKDNFLSEKSHVLLTLIRKFHFTKEK